MDAKQQAAFAKLAQDIEQNKEGGSITFLKPGDNVLRIMVEPGTNLVENPTAFAAPTLSYYNGKATQRYLIFALVLQQGTELTPDEEKWKIKPVLLPKSVRTSIINRAAKGIDFFGKDGVGVIVMKTGTGFNTDYEVMATSKPIPYEGENLILPEKSLQEYADEYEAWSKGRQSSEVMAPPQAEASLGPANTTSNQTGGW